MATIRPAVLPLLVTLGECAPLAFPGREVVARLVAPEFTDTVRYLPESRNFRWAA